MSKLFRLNNRISFYTIMMFSMALFMAGCSDSGSKTGESEEVLSYKAKKQLAEKKYQSAIDPLTHLSNNYQVSASAQTYKLELMHAQYQAKEYMDAIETANQYVNLYPFEPHVDYALYIKASSSLREFKARHWMTQSISERFAFTDTEIIHSGLVAADTLVTAYPNSQYHAKAIDLKSQMSEIIMKKTFNIAKDYRNNHAYAGSQRRLTDVVTHTESKKLLRDALTMMRDNYTSMKQPENAAIIDKILTANWKR